MGQRFAKQAIAALILGVGAPVVCGPSPDAAATPVVRRSDIDDRARNPQLLLLVSGDFDPRKAKAQFTNDASTGFALPQIVQFEQARMRGARQRLIAAGYTVLSYLPNNAFAVRGRNAQRPLDEVAGVRAVIPVSAAMKLEPGLHDKLSTWSADSTPRRTLDVLAYPGENVAALADHLSSLWPDLQILAAREDPELPRLRISTASKGAAALIDRASKLNAVRWIEHYLQPSLRNQDAVPAVQANANTGTPIWDRGLLGSGQIIAVMDSGLDRNEDWFTGLDRGQGLAVRITQAESPIPPAIGSLDPEAKVVGYWVQPGALAYDDNSACINNPNAQPRNFHGTHVAGIVAADQPPYSTPESPNRAAGEGMAPNAQLLFQDIVNGNTGCLSVQDFQGSLKQALAGGAHLHNNSWGQISLGAYRSFDADADAASWVLEDLLVAVAAGNDGPAGGSVGTPGVAKNVLTVGALGHGNSAVVAGFSSPGPTNDGRIKPDLVAPGSATVSAAGNLNDSLAVQPGLTSVKSGTSMASPTALGAAALLRQYFEDGYYPRGERHAADRLSPSASLIKAFLLNGSQPIDGWPSATAGWGRINLEASLYFRGDQRRARYFERTHRDGLATADRHRYRLTVGPGQELRATLVWFDLEADPGAALNLVNDLDLVVEGPTGRYLGNVLANGYSLANSGAPDVLNTVEQVRLGPSAAAGPYVVEVVGKRVPGNARQGSDRQGYALVVSGVIGVPDQPPLPAPPAPTVASNDPQGVAIAFSTVAGASEYLLYRADGSCADLDLGRLRMVQSGADSPLVDSRPQGGFVYAYVLRAVGNGVEGERSACVDTRANTPCTRLPQIDPDGLLAAPANAECAVGLSWSAGDSNCPAATGMRYELQSAAGPDFLKAQTVVAELEGTSYVDRPVAVGQRRYYRLLAEDSAGNAAPQIPTLSIAAGPADFYPAALIDDAEGQPRLELQSPWSISTARSQAGVRSYRNAMGDQQQRYPNATCAYLTTPMISVPAAAQLQFSAWYALEAGWDGVVVEVSEDLGASWHPITPSEGYPGDFGQTASPPNNACGYPRSQGAFSGFSGGRFKPFTLDLSAYAGTQIRLRWAFSSDSSVNDEGFYLDQLRMSSAATLAGYACKPR